MMKVSDPIMFGHCVEVFYRDTFAKHADFVKEHNVDATKGLGDFYAKLEACGDSALKEQISNELEECLKNCDHVRPPLAMVDSDRGVTNLHVPSDIITTRPCRRPGARLEDVPTGELADTKYGFRRMRRPTKKWWSTSAAPDPSTTGGLERGPDGPEGARTVRTTRRTRRPRRIDRRCSTWARCTGVSAAASTA